MKSKETKNDYLDNVLIKLRRQYSADETVAALSKRLTEKDIEIGQLKAELDYLNNEGKDLDREVYRQLRKEELYNEQAARIKKLKEENQALTYSRDLLLKEKYSIKP